MKSKTTHVMFWLLGQRSFMVLLTMKLKCDKVWSTHITPIVKLAGNLEMIANIQRDHLSHRYFLFKYVLFNDQSEKW